MPRRKHRPRRYLPTSPQVATSTEDIHSSPCDSCSRASCPPTSLTANSSYCSAIEDDTLSSLDEIHRLGRCSCHKDTTDKKEIEFGVTVKNKKKKSSKALIHESWFFDENGIGRSGHILSRTTKMSLMFRRWKECYWVHLQPAMLLLFRSEEDFRAWQENASNDRSNDRLVVWSINFDTMGFLEKKQKKKLEKEGDKSSLDKEEKGGKVQRESNSSTKKSIHLPNEVFKYAMMDVHSKSYDKKELLLHGFKLERWSRVGTSVTAAFASNDKDEVKAIRRVIGSCLEMTSKNPKKGTKR